VASLREIISSDGALFLDHRLFGGQARLQMPALLYLRSVLWRAYRLPATLLGRPATSFQLVDRQLIGVTHDAAGVISLAEDQPLHGAGYVIAQGGGFQSQTALRALNPDWFNLLEWATATSTSAVARLRISNPGSRSSNNPLPPRGRLACIRRLDD
jgi:hypothetical protein